MQRAVQLSSVQTVVASCMGRSSCILVLLRLLPVSVHFFVSLFVNFIFSSLAPCDDRGLASVSGWLLFIDYFFVLLSHIFLNKKLQLILIKLRLFPNGFHSTTLCVTVSNVRVP